MFMRLCASRKFVVLALALVGVFVLVGLGRIGWAEAVMFLSVSVPVFVASVAIEDAAAKKTPQLKELEFGEILEQPAIDHDALAKKIAEAINRRADGIYGVKPDGTLVKFDPDDPGKPVTLISSRDSGSPTNPGGRQ